MSTRVRYKELEAGILTSNSYKTSNDEVVVNIKPDNTFVICNLKGELKANSEGIVKTLSGAKKLAKKALEALGVVFEAEVRPRLNDNVNEAVLVEYESNNFGDK